MSDEKIKREMHVVHEGMAKAVEEWSQEMGLDEMSREARDILVSTFREGYSTCLNRTLRPAVDLSMVLLQLISLQRSQGAKEFKISAEALGFFEGLCHKIAGVPEQWQLDDIVETANAGELPDPTDGWQKVNLEGGSETE
jgi:hypothetical protein